MAIEGGDKERNMQVTSGQTHTAQDNSEIKTHFLMLAMEGADKERSIIIIMIIIMIFTPIKVHMYKLIISMANTL